MIFGFIADNSSYTKNKSLIKNLITRILNLNIPYKYVNTFIDDKVAIARVYRRNSICSINQPVKTHTGFLFFEGYLINGFLYDVFTKPINDINIEHLNGGFCVCEYDHDILKLINDKYGLRNFWYYISNDKFWFSSSPIIFSIINENYHIDFSSLMEFLRFGEVLEDRTLLTNVKHLKNASILNVNVSSLNFKIHGYWDYCFKPQIISDDEWAFLFTHQLRNAMLSFLDKHNYYRIGISLSGGLDSRIVAASLTTGGNILTYTYGDLKSLECRIANLISKKLRLNNVYIPFNYREIKRYVDLSILLTLGGSPAFYLPYVASIISKYIDIYIHGFEGDLLFRGSYINFFKKCLCTNNPTKLAEYVYNRFTRVFTDSLLVKVFDEEVVENSRRKIIDIIRKSFIESRTNDPANMIDYFLLKNHAVNYILLGSVLTRPWVEDVEITFDDGLINLYLRTHPIVRLSGIAYAKSLKLLNRKLANIPLIGTLTSPTSSFRKCGEAMVKAYNKISWILIRRTKGRINLGVKLPLMYIDSDNFLRKVANDYRLNHHSYQIPLKMYMILRRYLNFDEKISFREANVSYMLLKLYENYGVNLVNT